MKKSEAIELLGNAAGPVAQAVGVTPYAVGQWPEDLPTRIADRVQAALWRQDQAKKTAKKPNWKRLELTPVKPRAGHFNTTIPTTAQSDRTNAIKGKP
jgi:hypothetical protein